MLMIKWLALFISPPSSLPLHRYKVGTNTSGNIKGTAHTSGNIKGTAHTSGNIKRTAHTSGIIKGTATTFGKIKETVHIESEVHSL